MVVGIVTVLIAILMPALGRAREQANRIKCAANLRSIGQALTMYVQQYRYYPGALGLRSGAMPAQAAIWPPRLRQFMGENKQPFYCPSQDERCRWTDGGDAQPTIAADGDFLKFGYQSGESLIHPDAYFSYGYNAYGTNLSVSATNQRGLGAMVYPYDAELRELPAARVRAPAEMIAITDSTADGRMDCIVYPIGSPGFLPGRIHGGGSNVLFCDGHVTWYRQEDLVAADKTDLSKFPTMRMWNRDQSGGIGHPGY